MAATIDNTITYRNYNTIKMVSPAIYKSYAYSVSGMTAISHGFYVYGTSALTLGVRARTRFYDATGLTLSTVDHSFAVTAGDFVWEKIENVTVPTGAKYVKLELINSTGTYWVGLIKSESGSICTDFTVNYSGQLTTITAGGIYTGTVTANQVIVSGNEDLLSHLTVIGAGQITLRSDVDGALPKITKLTAGGVYTGEVVASQITTGILKSANNYSRINLDDGTLSFGNGALVWNGASLVVQGSFGSTEGTQTAKMDGGSFRLVNGATDMGYLSVQSSEPTGPWLTAADAATTITLGKVVGGTLHMSYRIQYPNASSYDATHYFYGAINVETINTTTIKDLNGKIRIQTYDNSVYLKNPLGVSTFSSDNFSTFIQYAANSGALGVDSTGPFYVTNAGVKKYLT